MRMNIFNQFLADKWLVEEYDKYRSEQVKERNKLSARKFYKENTEQCKASVKKWVQNNREEVNIKQRERSRQFREDARKFRELNK